jgi:hypothetical protein
MDLSTACNLGVEAAVVEHVGEYSRERFHGGSLL